MLYIFLCVSPGSDEGHNVKLEGNLKTEEATSQTRMVEAEKKKMIPG